MKPKRKLKPKLPDTKKVARSVSKAELLEVLITILGTLKSRKQYITDDSISNLIDYVDEYHTALASDLARYKRLGTNL